MCAGAWNNNLHIFISCLTQYLCLSLCTGSSEAARGRVCVCESQPRSTEQPEPLIEYTAQLRCQWRWLWSALKCCSSANFHLQIWHFARPPAFLPGYALLLLQPDSFNYEFLCLLYPLNCLVSYLSCYVFDMLLDSSCTLSPQQGELVRLSFAGWAPDQKDLQRGIYLESRNLCYYFLFAEKGGSNGDTMRPWALLNQIHLGLFSSYCLNNLYRYKFLVKTGSHGGFAGDLAPSSPVFHPWQENLQQTQAIYALLLSAPHPALQDWSLWCCWWGERHSALQKLTDQWHSFWFASKSCDTWTSEPLCWTQGVRTPHGEAFDPDNPDLSLLFLCSMPHD